MPTIAYATVGRCPKGYGWQAIMYYTYILESLGKPGHKYIGHTSDLKRRLKDHNSGSNKSTAKYRPWKLLVYLAFETLEQAQHMEGYLKSGSGKAFARRHLC